MDNYLAVDIGASSGRHILGYIKDNKLCLEEVYRFKNEMIQNGGHLTWNVDILFDEIKKGIKKCANEEKQVKSIGIDTWAVDYVLLDKAGNRIHESYAYRDSRVDAILNGITNSDLERLYEHTGIQHQKFNTIFQLLSENRQDISQSCYFLMIPDYFNYLMIGKKFNEYTNFSTTQLMDIGNKRMSDQILGACHIKKEIFQEMISPLTNLGPLKDELSIELQLKCDVIAVASHDTASAYLATVDANSIIISSGTWSLLGILVDEPIMCSKALKANFTNEGGFGDTYRFLKNIMGLWMIQEVVRELNGEYSFTDLVNEARRNVYHEIFDVNDNLFLTPPSMTNAINHYFETRNIAAPQNIGELAYCIYNSLAHSYACAIAELEDITNKTYQTINILGGGCQNELLNELIAKVCRKRVVAGPIEATAIGNLVVQLIADGVLKDIETGRKLICDSFVIRAYER